MSNFPSALLAEAQTHLREHRLVADQVEYSLEEQELASVLLPFCRRNGVTLIAYTPLAKGRLARPGNVVLDELAEKYRRTQAQVSLNWLIGQEGVVAIPKASDSLHLEENLGALGWRLSEGDYCRLTESFA